ncbi:MAG: hypothetical protein R2695_08005 [Acidimicrobiales bacterium]
MLHGRCLPYGEANVWWPIAEAIQSVVGIDGDTAPDIVPALVTASVADAFGTDPDDTNVARTAEGLRHLLGYDSGLSRLDAERAGEEGTRAALALIHELSVRSPVLLWISDLDWADDAVLRLLDDLLDRLGRRSVVVLVTGRAEMFDRWRPRQGRFNSITMSVESLDDVAGDLLARELLPEASDELRRRLVERAGGNPLFLEEMARMVDEAGGEVAESLPANVRSVISARLDALESPALHVIEDAAVLGLRGDVGALQRMAEFERGEPSIGDALRALERVDLLETMGSVWSFRSNLVRDVVYGRLTKTDRAWRHAGIASWIEANKKSGSRDALSYHYRRAAGLAAELGGVPGLSDDVVEKAIHWTLASARATTGRAAMERAERLFGEVLDLMTDDDPRRAEVLLERAAAALGRLHTDTARRDLALAEPLVEAAGDPRLTVRQTLLRSELAQWTGGQDEALALAEKALATAVEIGDRSSRPTAAPRRHGPVVPRAARPRRVVDQRRLRRAAAAGDANGMAWARQNLAWIACVRPHGRRGDPAPAGARDLRGAG